jgi:hypothetical protein
MKSKAQLLVEILDKKFEEMGWPKLKEEKKEGQFVYIPASNNKESQPRKEDKNG